MPGKESEKKHKAENIQKNEISEIATQEFRNVRLNRDARKSDKLVMQEKKENGMQKNVGLATQFVNRIYLRVREIKEENPDIAAEIDMNEWFLKQHMKTIRSVINQLPEEDKELVTLLVITGLHQMIDEQLIYDANNIKDADAKEVEMRRSRKISIKTETDTVET